MAHPRVATREQSVLLVVDLQPPLLAAVHQPERLLANCELLLKVAGDLGVPILATEQNPERLGATPPEVAGLLPAAPVGKMAFSCLGAPEVVKGLERSGRSAVVLVGVETHVCVSQTAHDLLDRGYRVHVPLDAVSSCSEANWRVGLGKMRDAGAVISSAEAVVFEWLGRAGTLEFRRALPLIKEAARRCGGV